MTLKEKVFEFIQKRGPQTYAELVAKFKVKKASMRRTCGVLMHEGKLVPIKSEGGCRYGLSADTRAAVNTAHAEAVPEQDSATGLRARKETQPDEAGKKYMPKPTPHKKRAEDDKPPEIKDWRMTDFCF